MDLLFSILTFPLLGVETWLWSIFLFVVTLLIVFDLGVLHKKDQAMSFSQSLKLTVFYVICSILFGVWIWTQFGAERAVPYFTAYLVEKSLSLDNIFIISLIFGYYKIPLKYQHRVLFWGIIGVILLRGVVISTGAYITANFEWVLYIFALLLIYTGIKIFFSKEEDNIDVENSKLRKALTTHFNVTNTLQGNKFIIWNLSEKSYFKKMTLTPLFMALITIEFADLLFAMDSIPAVLAISTDTFVILTSNVFAILGLRAMYFMLADLLDRFEHLKYALSVVLIFIGGKIFYGHFFHKIDPVVSLFITLVVLLLGAVYSFAKTKEITK